MLLATKPKNDLSALEGAKNLLPESMLEIIDVIGFKAATRLVDNLGGRQIHVGKGIKKESIYLKKLKDAIGDDATKVFCQIYGGQADIYIPNCHAAILHLRNEQFRVDIATAVESGKSKRLAVLELCGKYGFSDRRGWEILKIQQPKIQQILI